MNTPENQIQYLPIGKINANPDNPRRNISQAAVDELSASIRQVGVLQPITVRPVGRFGNYRVVCGSRRLMAAADAGLATIPAIVRELSDDEAFDIAVTENLQREDISPLDEASAFKAMIDTGRYALTDIAARFGKSEVFVHQRQKLLDLIPPFQAALEDGQMSLAVANLLARLPQMSQQFLLDETDNWNPVQSRSAKQVEKLIEEKVYLNLSGARFQTTDPDLVPVAGPCSTCVKRTGASPTLFADVDPKSDRCLDRACFEGKTLQHLRNRIDDAVASGDDPVIAFEYKFTDLAKEAKSKGMRTIKSWSVNKLKGKGTAPKDSTPFQALFITDDDDGGRIRSVWVGKSSYCVEDVDGKKPAWLGASTKAATGEASELSKKIADLAIKRMRQDALVHEKLGPAVLDLLDPKQPPQFGYMAMVELVILLLADSGGDYGIAAEAGLDRYDQLGVSRHITANRSEQMLHAVLVNTIKHRYGNGQFHDPEKYRNGHIVSRALEFAGLVDPEFKSKHEEIRSALVAEAEKKKKRINDRIAELKAELQRLQKQPKPNKPAATPAKSKRGKKAAAEVEG